MTKLDYIRDPAEITRRSFEIIAAEVDLAVLPEEIAPVVARVVHASGMPDVVGDLAYSQGVVAVAREALAAGAPILCDVGMVAAGVSARAHSAAHPVHAATEQLEAADLARRSGQTRSAAGMELLACHHHGAVVVIGNAPTALFRLLELVADGAARPAAVLGFPVGFVGAAESKTALAENRLGLPFITLFGRRGGSAIAAAALNAIILGGAE
jgi:precorrin-8X/cobalt-precorrin-8 methylmutase